MNQMTKEEKLRLAFEKYAKVKKELEEAELDLRKIEKYESRQQIILNLAIENSNQFIELLSTKYPLTEYLIEKYKTKWGWGKSPFVGLSCNVSLPWSIELIAKYRDEWSWNELSNNDSLPWSIYLIEKYEEKWYWEWLSSNDSLPWSIELIEKYKEKWYWKYLSGMADLPLPWSMELIEKYEDKWDFNHGLDKNTSLHGLLDCLKHIFIDGIGNV